ncbi:dTMP kinase [Candidatus Poribacteria bacterium]|nr:dTMP kinase [Candidatus Poribacteria bacterium]
MQKKEGIFIVFEGPNGSGKSNLAQLTKEWLSSNFGREVILITEPSKTTIGKLVRHYSEMPQHAYTLACLVCADRYQNIVESIVPNLKQNKIVISDRYFASSLVYQIMHGVTYEFVLNINSQILTPDLTIIVEASEQELRRRIQNRGTKQLFEHPDNVSTEVQLYKESLSYLKDSGHVTCCIDNSGAIEVAFQEVKDSISRILHDKL